MVDNEEYEVIPTSPIRRLEKRIARLEETSSASEVRKLIEQIIELIKSNQRLVDDVIKANSELINEIAALPGKIDNLVSAMGEFLQILRASATEEVSKESVEPVVKKIEELVEQNKKTAELQQAMINLLDMIDKRLKRLYYPEATK
jgi:methyl-accepting chemotaxis protein